LLHQPTRSWKNVLTVLSKRSMFKKRYIATVNL